MMTIILLRWLGVMKEPLNSHLLYRTNLSSFIADSSSERHPLGTAAAILQHEIRILYVPTIVNS
jgi:hypothetical protein